MKKYVSLLPVVIFVVTGILSCTQTQKKTVEEKLPVREVWTTEQANDWYKDWGWLRGADFIPSTAINQLEMWQAETFDPETIDRELGFAEGIGFNSMRVYLHHLAWQIDTAGFKKRMREYLDISGKHGIYNIADNWRPV